MLQHESNLTFSILHLVNDRRICDARTPHSTQRDISSGQIHSTHDETSCVECVWYTPSYDPIPPHETTSIHAIFPHSSLFCLHPFVPTHLPASLPPRVQSPEQTANEQSELQQKANEKGGEPLRLGQVYVCVSVCLRVCVSVCLRVYVSVFVQSD